jgi:predicted O-methyltransferase YrrM
MQRTFRHWTCRYIYDRIQQMMYQRTHPDAPWFCTHMIDLLDAWLKPTDNALEWGSGRSTAWLARRVGHLTSVEHDANWAKRVQNDLRAGGLISKVDYRLMNPAEGADSDCAYVNIVEAFEDASLDFCLVDGRFRADCSLRCLKKLKAGGALVIDDVQRYLPREPKPRSPNARSMKDGFASETWEQFAECVSGWRCIWMGDGMSDAVFYIKNCN